MEPTLRDGDVVLVLWRAHARVGDLVLVDLPPDPDGRARPMSVKRCTGTDPDDRTRLWLERDNPDVGVDSWLIGSVERGAVRGRVMARLPRPHRGMAERGTG